MESAKNPMINKLEENLIALLLVAMTLLVFIETILRFLGTGILWAEELTLHLSAWMVLFGASYVLKQGGHIGVDALVKKLPDTSQRIITLIMLAAATLYCALFMYGSWVYLHKIWSIGIEMEDLPIPKWIAHSILFIGFALFAIRLIQAAIQVAKGEQTTLHVHNEAKSSIELSDELNRPSEQKT